MNELEILMNAIRRRKEDAASRSFETNEIEASDSLMEDREGLVPVREDELKDLPEADEVDDNLAPPPIKQSLKRANEESFEDEAERVLGRKPMSTVSEKKNERKKKKDPMDEASLAVMDQMTDTTLQNQLKSGRKPSRLRDKVQLNIMELQKQK